jgi:hypothetical protein
MVVFLSALSRLFADLLLELLVGDEGIEKLDHLALGARRASCILEKAVEPQRQ